MMTGLQGRTVLVTGGARGICRATAKVLAEAGATIAIVDRMPADDTVKLVESVGGRAGYAVADVADADAFLAAMDHLDRTVGPPDALLYGAGITTHIARLTRMTLEGWRQELSVNLTGAFLAAQHVLPYMIEQRWGRIVFISSVAATGGLTRQAGYSASKAGLLGLARTIALEVGADGVTCNSILPGLIATEVVQSMPSEISAAVVDRTPARRLGRMEEVASMVRYLLSDDAGFVNGADFVIDGGHSLGMMNLSSRPSA